MSLGPLNVLLPQHALCCHQALCPDFPSWSIPNLFEAQALNRPICRLGKPRIFRGCCSFVLPCISSGAAARSKAHQGPLAFSMLYY